MPSNTPNLLDHLITGSIGPLSQLQQSLNLTIDQITSWIGKAQTREQIDNLQMLFNAQAQLMICQHRLFAVAKLTEVVATASAPETIRRACMNLLNIELVEFSEDKGAKPSGGGDPMPPLDDPTREMILHALGEVGRKDRESRQGASESAHHDAPPTAHHDRSDGADRDANAEAEARSDAHRSDDRPGPQPVPERDAARPSLFSQKGTEVAAAAAPECAVSPGPRPQTASEQQAQAARAHYASPTEFPRSDSIRGGHPPLCAMWRQPCGARTSGPSRLMHHAHGRDPPIPK